MEVVVEGMHASGGGRAGVILLLSLLMVFSFSSLSAEQAGAGLFIRGMVLDEKDAPIRNAMVSVWLMNNIVSSGVTGSDGLFNLEVKSDARHVVYVLADVNSTPGVDYLPSRAEASPSEGDALRFNLFPAASVFVDGDIQFVESEELPYSFTYTVLDPVSGEASKSGGNPLRYGVAPESLSRFLDLKPSHIIVPAGVPFRIRANASILIGSSVAFRSFETDGEPFAPIDAGGIFTFDVRRDSVPFNCGLVEQLHGRVEARIGGMESLGFYLTPAKATAASSSRVLAEARLLYDEGRYVESFDAAKRSYIALRQTLNDLGLLQGDAATSVYVLIFFFGLASTGIAYLLSDRNVTRLVGGSAVYSVALSIFRITYPGSNIISSELFAVSAALALAFSLTLGVAMPRLFRGGGRGGRIPVRNILVPIVSMAKRNILRRRLRFALTLTSIAVLVMSFVALTSFSEGYGLLVSRVSGAKAPYMGVLLRAQGYTEREPVFMRLTDIERDWLERQPEGRVVSVKMENLPLTRPVTKLNGEPISGVVGIDPRAESEVFNLEGIINEGSLPSDGGVLISGTLRRRLGAELNESLKLGDVQVTLQGVFDDDALSGWTDLDGSSYLPKKLVNTSPEGEVPSLELVPCEPSEIVITSLSTASRILLVGIARIDLGVDEGVSVRDLAERLAIERGYQAWAPTPEGIYLARLGSYLEGKGLSLAVPLVIVVLNVVVTVLNSMFERRREIGILSSVGLNPAQIAAIFVAEASALGLIAGGIGYLAGISLYRVMTYFNLALEVHQKISALWSVASIGVAMVAALMGALVALRSSVVITPSLTRRWRLEKGRGDITEPWESTIPVRLMPEEVEGFVEFVVRALRAYEDDPVRSTSNIRLSRDEGTRSIGFLYRTVHANVSNFYTKNILIVEVTPSGVSLRQRTYGEEGWAHDVGTLVRHIAMEWSTTRGRPQTSGGG